MDYRNEFEPEACRNAPFPDGPGDHSAMAAGALISLAVSMRKIADSLHSIAFGIGVLCGIAIALVGEVTFAISK